MTGYFQFKTHAGIFRIVPHGGLWAAAFEDETLGVNYLSAQHALDDLAGGHCDWPSCGDPSSFGLPDDIGGWTFVRRR